MHLDFERIAFGTVVGVTGAAVALTRYRWPLTETRGEPREAMIEKSGSQKTRCWRRESRANSSLFLGDFPNREFFRFNREFEPPY